MTIIRFLLFFYASLITPNNILCFKIYLFDYI